MSPLYEKKLTITAVTFLGSFFIWFSYLSFIYLIPLTAKLYFPYYVKTASTVGIIATLLSLYIAKPLGAILFGFIGDRYSRSKALSITLLLMGIASLTLSYLPIYMQIGMLAPILAAICRLAQGIAFAGEIGGASLFLFEHANKQRLHLASSWPIVAVWFGVSLAYLYPQWISQQALIDWAWRLPFLLSAIGCLVLSYFRWKLPDTKSFATHHQPFPIIAIIGNLFRHHKIHFLYAFITSGFVVIYFHICFFNYAQYLISYGGFSAHVVMSLIIYSTIALLLLIPLMAMMADRIGERNMVLAGLAGCTMVAPLLFMIVPLHSLFTLVWIEAFFAFFTACAIAPLFYIQIHLFPAEIRYTALSLAWCISLSLLGTPLAQATNYLWHQTHWHVIPSLTASLSAMVAFVTMISIMRSKHYPAIESLSVNPATMGNL